MYKLLKFCFFKNNHQIFVFNSKKSPTDDIKVRQAIIHAVDKAHFLENEFANLEEPVTQLLPRSAPFCNIDLSPKWGYDVEKAKFLNCPREAEIKEVEGPLGAGAIAGIAIASIIGVSLIAFVARMIKRERQGKPIFAPPKEAAQVS